MEGHYIELSCYEKGDKRKVLEKRKKYTDEVFKEEIPTNIWSTELIAIPFAYMTVGFLNSFPNAYIQYYPRTLGASNSQLSTIGTIRSLPWTIKFAYGVCADAFPIAGRRFKPYMALGMLISSSFCALMAFMSTPDVVVFAMLLLGINFGSLMTDVMADALVATKAQKEPRAERGTLQSTVYITKFSSEAIGHWLGAVICNKDEWGWGLSLSQAFGMLAIIPIFITIPAIYYLKDERVERIMPIYEQLQGIWKMVQSQAVWQPLSFIVIYNGLSLYNAAWGNYLQVAYHFSAFQYGSMTAVGSTVGLAGIYVYKQYYLHSNRWQLVYFFTTIVMTLFAVLNILLVFRLNEVMGIPPFWFAMGDNAIQYFAYGVQYLPSVVMFVSLCPEGQEGVMFAGLTSYQNLSGGFATTISNLLLGIWPVQLNDLEEGHFSGVWKLSILANAISLLPLLLLPILLPSGVEELEKLKKFSSRTGGICMLLTFFFGFIWVVTLSFLAILEPCQPLVGGSGCS